MNRTEYINKLEMKKIVLWLTVIAFATLAIGAFLFFQFDVKAALNSERNENVYNVNEDKSFKVSDIEKINLDTSSANINIIITDDDVVRIHIYGDFHVSNSSTKPEPEIKLEGGTLYALENRKVLGAQNKLRFFTFGSFNRKGVLMNELRMDAYIPKSYSTDLTLNTSSGNIKAGDLSLDSLTANTFSGNIEIKNIDAASVRLDTSSGNTTLGEVKTKLFKHESFSGDISIRSLQSEDSDISSSSGRINVDNGKNEVMRFKTFSGDIRAEKLGSKNTYVDTSSGRIKVTGLNGKLKTDSFSGDLEAQFDSNLQSIDVSSSSGRVNITLPSDSVFDLNADSSSGRVECDFPLVISGKSSEHDIKGSVNGTSSSNRITIKTFSGDIKIMK